MATPYFQLRMNRVASTQDVARDKLEDMPVLVLATGQSEGRGRSGAVWLSADRALAASLAFRCSDGDTRPLSLMAGVAAVRATSGTTLKWPNDVLIDGAKAGGILVERTGDVTVIGLGLNLWWPTAPEGMTGLSVDDPGGAEYSRVGGLWGAELMELIEADGWPIDEYRSVCTTIGRDIDWEPEGSGRAVEVTGGGALVVDVGGVEKRIYSGSVRHVTTSS